MLGELGRHKVAEERDGPVEPYFKQDLRLPSKQIKRLADIRAALFGVTDRKIGPAHVASASNC